MILRTIAVCIILPISLAAGQSQRAMNDRASRAARRADSTLTSVYRQVETKYRTDSVALRKLQVAQRAWLVYRDAQVDATYPAIDKVQVYGSVLPMCVSALLEELTKARIAELRRALRPAEGDVCGGGPG